MVGWQHFHQGEEGLYDRTVGQRQAFLLHTNCLLLLEMWSQESASRNTTVRALCLKTVTFEGVLGKFEITDVQSTFGDFWQSEVTLIPPIACFGRTGAAKVISLIYRSIQIGNALRQNLTPPGQHIACRLILAANSWPAHLFTSPLQVSRRQLLAVLKCPKTCARQNSLLSTCWLGPGHVLPRATLVLLWSTLYIHTSNQVPEYPGTRVSRYPCSTQSTKCFDLQLVSS